MRNITQRKMTRASCLIGLASSRKPKFGFIELLRFSSVISSGAQRSREIRKYSCRRTDFSTRLRLGRNDTETGNAPPPLSFRAERSGVEKSVIPKEKERISPLACGSVEMTCVLGNNSINRNLNHSAFSILHFAFYVLYCRQR